MEKEILGSNMSMQKTANANRIHIGIFGKVNSGKSTLLNAITKQEVAIVSSLAGTTTDPIYKAIELHEIGPVVFMDTAGFDDATSLQEKRLLKTKEAFQKSDIAIFVVNAKPLMEEKKWIHACKEKGIPYLIVYNKQEEEDSLQQELESELKETLLCVNAKKQQGIETILEALSLLAKERGQEVSITGNLCQAKDHVVLVMPQDIQAPKGRLILAQVQTLRELLDKQCIVTCCTPETLQDTLDNVRKEPQLIICDSQVFKQVYEVKPQTTLLTSFSVLFAHYKGDINVFKEGVKALDTLHNKSRVLIAEACTHAPVNEDIGRVKIPALLRKRYGEAMQIDVVSGNDFPSDLQNYDLIIHCGACMFNRQYVLTRIEQALQANIPITNYGICLAYLQGILDTIVNP